MSAPVSPSSHYPRSYEGSGLGACGDGQAWVCSRCGVKFASRSTCQTVLVGEVLESEDVQPKRFIQSPTLPPQSVIDEHKIDHCPYRSWCDACREGFGCERDHRHVDEAKLQL